MAAKFAVVYRNELVAQMKMQGETVRSLAAKVNMIGSVMDPPVSISSAMVGHLRSGKVKYTSPSKAQTIERALGCPPGSLFRYSVTAVA